MAKIKITQTELVWPGKYNEDGTRRWETPQRRYLTVPLKVEIKAGLDWSRV